MDSIRGKLLIAGPTLQDPNFWRTVVLVVEHTEDGALGLVLNRPSETTVGEVVPQLADLVDPAEDVLVGGPVQPSAVIVLADFMDPLDAALIAFAGVGVMGASSEPAELVGGVRSARAFAGHAGWGPGQLDRELEGGDWILEPARHIDAFTPDPTELWSDVLSRKGGSYALVAGCHRIRRPTDPAATVGADSPHSAAGRPSINGVEAHDHTHEPVIDRGADAQRLKAGLGLIVAFMVVEIAVGLAAHSLALESDAAHMLTDAFALAVSLVAARLAMRPAGGAMTFGLGRAEILSAEANALTMLVLAGLILYGGIDHLIHPSPVRGWPVLIVALVGIVVNLVVVRVLGGHGHAGHGHDHGRDHAGHGHDDGRAHSLNIQGSIAHIATDLFGFIVTAVAAGVILATGFRRADAIVSLLIAAVMIYGGLPLLGRSLRVMMEAAPAGIDPLEIGNTLAGQPGVSEVHDLHVWEVTSGFPTLSAHIVVDLGHDCHQVRSDLTQLLEERFEIPHSTLQVEHAQAPQPPLQIEVVRHV